jgi:hypothetical protein
MLPIVVSWLNEVFLRNKKDKNGPFATFYFGIAPVRLSPAAASPSLFYLIFEYLYGKHLNWLWKIPIF